MAKFANAEVKALWDKENAVRHATLDAMRQEGPAFKVGGKLPKGFDALYAEERAWLAANGLAYSPSKGWHVKKIVK